MEKNIKKGKEEEEGGEIEEWSMYWFSWFFDEV